MAKRQTGRGQTGNYRLIRAILDSLQDRVEHILPGRDSRTELLRYYLAAVLRLWGSNVSYCPEYAVFLEEISGHAFSQEQITAALSRCLNPTRRLQVPEFYKQIVEADVQAGTSHTADVLEELNDLLVAAAMVNGDFTIQEASCLCTITDDLVRCAKERGVRIRELPDPDWRVTNRGGGGYGAAGQMGRRGRGPQAPGRGADAAAQDPDQAWAQAEAKAAALPAQAAAKEEETMEQLLEELDGLVGLANVKEDVRSLMNFIKVTNIRAKRGMTVPAVSYHLVFTGNPGTGKTTVARLVSRLYCKLGILPQGQLVETDRSALVAGYLGQTAIKTQEVIQQAMGGVLFIDEAYALAGDSNDTYGKEAIETILKAMEDHREELVVIVAGYTDLMHRFIDSNPGLSSRFSKYFEFPDYSGADLLAILQRFCRKNSYRLDEEAQTLAKEHLEALYLSRDRNFGNARTVRNLFEKAINAQADRIAKREDILTDEDLETITAEDLRLALGEDVGRQIAPQRG